MELSLDSYVFGQAADALTPALLIYPEVVQANIQAALHLMGNDPSRWRPHIKTVKSAQVIGMLIEQGVDAFKCATTLELLMCCEGGARDVLFAMPAFGRTVKRVAEIAAAFPRASVSVLVEAQAQLRAALDQNLDVFIDINPGMNRTGVSEERIEDIQQLARMGGSHFRGLHFYDGQISSGTPAEREKQAQSGYVKLLAMVEALGMPVGEVITSGTPATSAALQFHGFSSGTFQHRVSPGTVLFNDLNSLGQLPDLGFAPAVLVLTTVVSHPAPDIVTCDAGHKSVSVDSGFPHCLVVGRPDLEPLKPSEEHLPIRVPTGRPAPSIGEHLYLLPKHICPTVNLFDEALAVQDGQMRGSWQIQARGHEPAVV